MGYIELRLAKWNKYLNLEWDKLALRRQISRLKLLYKAIHFSSGLKIPDYYNQELLCNQLDLIILYITHLH